MSERKRTTRRALQLQATILQPGKDGVRTSGRLTNVSGGGAHIATYEVLPVGTLIVLEIEYPSRTVRISGRVVHTESSVQAGGHGLFKAGMGVRFDRPDAPEVMELAGLGKPLIDEGGRRKEPR